MSAQFGKVGVLYGGKSAERDVSIMSGTGVHRALRSAGVEAHLFDTGVRSLAELAEERFDRVFIALHGRYGEDGTIQGALELLRVPYTGSGPLASALAMDKTMTKRIWVDEGLPTPRFESLDRHSDLARVAARLGLPLIVKPPHEGSTIGVTKVDDPAGMRVAYDLAAEYDEHVLAESFIQGRELTVAILGTGAAARALPVVEIVAPDGNYDYEHKYFTDDTRYLCPAQLPPAVTQRVQDISEAAYRVLGCEGWGRVDVMLDADNQPYLLEVNTSPGMTGHSLVPMAAAADGMSYETLCVEILKDARCKVSSRSS
ncbi:D-alanine--D-alanine ligase [Pigmentiphaga sp.]|uniref:D-alanine--D-alanine ligase n=1 Tax=Pigmentiphaga sp. TaxID=1977564 RepID=UPI00128BBDBF|nr:D-alanine--D-alanine ligase [Pigmentiphaga sp.]MPS25856.1 D-alanine--D-alanine ligase [Alcaligenaceae bacterium SAGV5]MPS54552.1 D-alanine--D-alanine ligase [Alcaligenaceae bacterium SAGV3]MPT55102.1 D-alanine--D-alanine ligase [Alcaligenaceae bacterium]